MKAAFVISAHRRWRQALAASLERRFGVPVCDVELALDEEPGPDSERAGYWVANQFRLLADRIEAFCCEHGGPALLRDAVGVIDFCSAHYCGAWDGIQLLHERAHPGISAVAFLVLAFPEVHWLLSTSLESHDPFFEQVHRFKSGAPVDEALKAHVLGFCALFDPGGLRARLRRSLVRPPTKDSVQAAYLVYPVRTRLAVIVDEEQAYAYLGSLVVFRCGYRALPITTWPAMREWLGKDGVVPDFAWEDLYLNFPDRPRSFDDDEGYRDLPSLGHRGLSNLAFRDLIARRLAEVRERRLLVTVGPGRDAERRRVWNLSLNYLSTVPCRAARAFKPVSGIHVVLRKAGLWDGARRQPKFPDEFRSDATSKDSPHSAPGRLLMVADRLLARGAQLLGPSSSVVDAVHAAVLAIEAKELLAGQTPTTSLEAIALQHEAEAMAESKFLGVSYNLNLRDRLREIEAEVKAVANRFHSSRIHRSAINAQLAIAERLAKRFHELNQIEEEMACLAEARRLRFDFWVFEKPWPWRWLMWLPLRYLAFTLTSLPRFLLAVFVWIFLFGLVYHQLGCWTHQGWRPAFSAEQIFKSVAASAFFTFTLQPAQEWSEVLEHRAALWHLVLAFQGAVSFANLGLFLSHLYMIVSRR